MGEGLELREVGGGGSGKNGFVRSLLRVIGLEIRDIGGTSCGMLRVSVWL